MSANQMLNNNSNRYTEYRINSIDLYHDLIEQQFDICMVNYCDINYSVCASVVSI